jgi:hypothetical protein
MRLGFAVRCGRDLADRSINGDGVDANHGQRLKTSTQRSYERDNAYADKRCEAE